MKKILCIIILIALVFSLTSCKGAFVSFMDWFTSGSDYYLEPGWNCDEEDFKKHEELWFDKIEQLIKDHELTCSKKVEKIRNNEEVEYHICVYLYCEEYTIQFIMSNQTEYALFESRLYYYGKDGVWGDYENFNSVVYLLRDFTPNLEKIALKNYILKPLKAKNAFPMITITLMAFWET